MKKFNCLVIMAVILSMFWIGCENAKNPVMSNEPEEPSLSLQKTTVSSISIPENAELKSATLNIYAYRVNSKNVNIFRITDDWKETDVTWNSFDGSYDHVPDPPSFIPNVKGWQKVDITNIVKYWLNGKYPNHGVLLDQESSTLDLPSYSAYHSRTPKFSAKDKVPYIKIEYKFGNSSHCIKGNISSDAYIWENHSTYTGNNERLYTGYVNKNEKQSLLKFDIKKVKCETAFAYSDEYSTCFLQVEDEFEQLEGYNFNNWGWTNGPLSEGNYYSFDIFAGAGQCDISKGTKVGVLSVDYSGGEATITYAMDQGFSLSEVHLYAGNDPLPKNGRDMYTVAPGQFPIVNENPDNLEHSVTIDDLSGKIYIVAHAVVCGEFKTDSENDEDGKGDDRGDDSQERGFKKLNIFRPGRGRGRR